MTLAVICRNIANSRAIRAEARFWDYVWYAWYQQLSAWPACSEWNFDCRLRCL